MKKFLFTISLILCLSMVLLGATSVSAIGFTPRINYTFNGDLLDTQGSYYSDLTTENGVPAFVTSLWGQAIQSNDVTYVNYSFPITGTGYIFMLNLSESDCLAFDAEGTYGYLLYDDVEFAIGYGGLSGTCVLILEDTTIGEKNYYDLTTGEFNFGEFNHVAINPTASRFWLNTIEQTMMPESYGLTSIPYMNIADTLYLFQDGQDDNTAIDELRLGTGILTITQVLQDYYKWFPTFCDYHQNALFCDDFEDGFPGVKWTIDSGYSDIVTGTQGGPLGRYYVYFNWQGASNPSQISFSPTQPSTSYNLSFTANLESGQAAGAELYFVNQDANMLTLSGDDLLIDVSNNITFEVIDANTARIWVNGVDITDSGSSAYDGSDLYGTTPWAIYNTDNIYWFLDNFLVENNTLTSNGKTPLSCYDFDDDLTDYFGYLDATVVGLSEGPPTVTGPLFESGLNGNSVQVITNSGDTDEHPTLPLNFNHDGFTLEIWSNYSSIDSNAMIWSGGSPHGNNNIAIYGGTDSIHFNLYDTNGASSFDTATPLSVFNQVMINQEWNQYVLTGNGTNFQAYYNGVLLTPTVEGNYDLTITELNSITVNYLGTFTFGYDSTARFDNVKIYNSFSTQSDVNYLYNNKAGRVCSESTKPTVLYCNTQYSYEDDINGDTPVTSGNVCIDATYYDVLPNTGNYCDGLTRCVAGAINAEGYVVGFLDDLSSDCDYTSNPVLDVGNTQGYAFYNTPGYEVSVTEDLIGGGACQEAILPPTCIPGYQCTEFVCQPGNIFACVSVIDANSCGEPLPANTTFNSVCIYPVPPPPPEEVTPPPPVVPPSAPAEPPQTIIIVTSSGTPNVTINETTNETIVIPPDVSNVTDLRIESTTTTIDFSGQGINLTQLINLTSFVTITANSVTIDSVNMPALNVPAVLTFTDVGSDYVIYKNGAVCTESECSNVNYNWLTGTLTFDVTGFSTYSVGEAAAAGCQDVKSTVFAAFALIAVSIIITVAFLLIKFGEGPGAYMAAAVTTIGLAIVLFVGYIVISSVQYAICLA